MADETTELLEMRCRACGTFMGFRRRIGRFVFWCSESCAESHMAKYDESQIRDETIVELFLEGEGVMEISRMLGGWPYQYIQQTLARRGLDRERAPRAEPDTAVALTAVKGEGGEQKPERRRLVRTRAS